MNWHDLDKIEPNDRLPFSTVERRFGIPRQTLWRWKKSGRLICITTRRGMCLGQRLIEAIEDRSLPS